MEDKLQRLAQLRADLAYFGTECLRIRDKIGQIEPFIFNDAQNILNTAIEKQKAEKGWVRVLVLKGRQQGISTYTAARFYHRTSMWRGTNTYILSHEQASSDNLFDYVDRYQRNNPIAPHVGVSNAKELIFDRLDSSYVVATAGQKAGGRGRSITLFHGSEVAYWANARDHFAASVQGVPLLPGTEIILESTSAGRGNEFYTRWCKAERGDSDYIPVFLAWWLTSEYRRVPEPGFALRDDADDGAMSEQEYAETYGLGLDQMAWRRSKIEELGSLASFQREYPATPAEAWAENDGEEPFVSSLSVVRARRRFRDNPKDQGAGPLILGVDPASMGGDRFAIAARRGYCVPWVKTRNKIDTLEGTAWVKSLIDQTNPARVNIDAGNIGAAIITNLKSYGPKYANIVRGVNFGATSQAKLANAKKPGPKLRRDEMWTRLRDWLAAEEGAQIPDDDELDADLTVTRQKHGLTNDIKLESKSEIKSRGAPSPDLGDAVALTFASTEFFAQYQDATKGQVFGDIDTLSHSDVALRHFGDPFAGEHGWMA